MVENDKINNEINEYEKWAEVISMNVKGAKWIDEPIIKLSPTLYNVIDFFINNYVLAPYVESLW